MKINHPKPEGKLFDQLSPGAPFEYGGEYFMKCPNYVAVNLATGEVHDFFRLNMVRPLNGAFVYE